MKRFLVGTITVIGLVTALSAKASADVLPPFSDSYTFLADYRTGVTAGPGYLEIPTFNTSLGTLLSVKLTYSLSSDVSYQITSNSSGSNVTAVGRIELQRGLFIDDPSVMGTTSLASLGGTFVDPIFDEFNQLNAGAFGVAVNTSQFSRNALPNQPPGSSPVFTQTVSASSITTFADGVNATQQQGLDFFKGDGVILRQFGAESKTAFSGTITGSNYTTQQVANDTGTLTVEYTFQPVPAPPAAISLGIGGLVGLLGTGVGKLRSRRKQAAKKS